MALPALGAVLGNAGRIAGSEIAAGGGRSAVMSTLKKSAADYIRQQGPRAIFNATGANRVPILNRAMGAYESYRGNQVATRAREAAEVIARQKEKAKEEAKRQKEEEKAKSPQNEEAKAAAKERRKEAAEERRRAEEERERQETLAKEKHDEAHQRATDKLNNENAGFLRTIASNTEETVTLLRNGVGGGGKGEGGSGGLMSTIMTIVGLLSMASPALMSKIATAVLPKSLLNLGGKLMTGARGAAGTVLGAGKSVLGAAGRAIGIGAAGATGARVAAGGLLTRGASAASGLASVAGRSITSAAGGIRGVAGGMVGKSIGKSVLKKIPLLGAVVGLGLGAKRAMAGDWTGAGMEAASGLASTIPGLGTAASLGIDAALMGKDAMNAKGATAGITTPSTPTKTAAPATAAVPSRAASIADNDPLKSVALSLSSMLALMTDKDQGIYVQQVKGAFDKDPIEEMEKKGFFNRMFGGDTPRSTGRSYTAGTSSTGRASSAGYGSGAPVRNRTIGNRTSGTNEMLIRAALEDQGITDTNAQAAILANFQAESNLEPINENMNYSGARLMEVFGTKYFKDINDANAVAAQGPEAIGNRVYGGRMGNAADEGYKYRGRGFVQLTGKDNYAKYSQMVFGDDRLVQNPDLLLDPQIAAQVSAAYVRDRTKGDYTVENVTRGIAPRNIDRAIAHRQSLVGNFLDGAPGQGGGSPMDGLVQGVTADLYAQTQAAIDRNVGYQMGAKNLASGRIDCSGWVATINQNMISSLQEEADGVDLREAKKLMSRASGGGAAGIIQTLSQASGELLHGANLDGVEDLREGMAIGIRGGRHARGRFNDIGHIVQVVKDPTTGELMISESSSSGGGVKLTKASDWMARQDPSKLYGADTYAALDSVTNGGFRNALQSSQGSLAPTLAQSQAEVEQAKVQNQAPVVIAPQTTNVTQAAPQGGAQPASGLGAPLQTRNPTTSIAAVNNSRMSRTMAW